MSRTDAYTKLRERMKEYGLTPEEEAAIEKAAGRVRTHSTIGTIAGASISFMIARRRGFTPPSTLLFTAGGFFVGSQLGLLTGAISSFRVIRKLPDPGHLISILREFQNEMVENRSRRTIPPVHPQPKHVDGFVSEIPHQEETSSNFKREKKENTDRMLNDQEVERTRIQRSRDPARQQESQNSSISMEPYAYPDNTSNSSASLPPNNNKEESGDTWAQIRSKKLPDEPTWAKIRERGMYTDSREDQTDQEEISGESGRPGREEKRREVKKRVNRYGDPIE